MITELNARAKRICDKLNFGSLNYNISFKIFPCLSFGGKEAAAIIECGLNNAIQLGNCYSISEDEVLEEIGKGFEYRGDDGSRPNWTYLDSKAFQSAKVDLMKMISIFVSSSTQIIGFWLKSGHPFYPVFWDYSFIIEQEADACLFIGSSSD